MPALSRWVITGTLTTNSPLHIGDGGVIARADRGGHGPARKGDKQPEISSIATDHEGRACVTASELKGFIRQMLLRHENNAAVLDLLGSQEKGGRVDPGNGFVGPEIPAGTLPPFWCEQRVTGVATSVAIGRRTRAARDKFLAFREFVPAAVPFNVRMRLTSPTEDEIVWLLAALESFSDPFGMQAIGANTVDGWGRMKWALGELRRFDACNVAAWLAMPAGKRPVGFEAAQAIPPAEQAALALKARQRFDAWSTTPRNVLRVHLELPFESDFVVRNPDPACHERPGADFAPVTDANGRPFLPADSFRGALRAQAERILRTRGGMDAACGPGKSCAAVKSVADVKQSCRVCRLFGATGWQSVVRLSDFTTMDAVPKERRHLVAIDRFTGGVAGPRKFEGDVANRPVLLGHALDRSPSTRTCQRRRGRTRAPGACAARSEGRRHRVRGRGRPGVGSRLG